jgi:hypothetical protein
LGGCLRQCPQRLVVEPTGGVKGGGPFLVRAKPSVKVKPHPVLVAILRCKDAVDPSIPFDEKRRLGLLRKVRVVIKGLPFVYLKEGNGWDIPRGRRNFALEYLPLALEEPRRKNQTQSVPSPTQVLGAKPIG